ncbi:transmembrane protein 160-like [Pongo abelii]|uniref:transmembrane protein 160-like n=1 Tax=Pongo abelii TaxID=9601 RepID=UPI0023E8738E|nr:transmembrane protein 160-like [Pongo abelii]
MKKRLTTPTSTFHLHPPAHLPYCLKRPSSTVKTVPVVPFNQISFTSTETVGTVSASGGRYCRLSGPAAGAPRGPSPPATAPATRLRRHLCPSWTVQAPGSSERRTRQLSSPASTMASWHRASGVISFMQSDMDREAAYGFFLLGGLCAVWGSASYVVGLAALRGPMQLTLGGAAAGAVLAASPLWVCAVGFYMGQLELDVELVLEGDGAASAEGPDEAGRPPPE